MRRWAWFVSALAAILIAAPGTVLSGATITYQAYVTDDTGAPINGPTELTFAVFDAPTGGPALWTESHSVSVDQGVFAVLLGSVTAFPQGLFEQPNLWLETRVAGSPLVPRRVLGSVPFAIHADRAALADSALAVPPTDSAWEPAGPNIHYDLGNVGIGTGTEVHDEALKIYRGAGHTVLQLQGTGTTNKQYIRFTDDGIGWSAGNTPQGNSFGIGRTSDMDDFVIDELARVGVGTPGPQAALHVHRQGDAGLRLSGGETVLEGSELIDAGDGIFRLRSSGNIVAFDGADNVGIGTTTPNAVLHLHRAEGANLRLSAGENTLSGSELIDAGDGKLRIRSQGNEVVFDDADLVGIGTQSPDQPLTVNGNVRIQSGGLIFPDGTQQTTATIGTGGQWGTNGNDIHNTNSGNVGIGTQTPSSTVHLLRSGVDTQIRLEGTNQNYDQSILFKDAGSEWWVGNRYVGNSDGFGIGRTSLKDDLVIGSEGNIGIGTPNPPQQLSLTGGIGFANQAAADKKLYSPEDGTLEWMTHDSAASHRFAISHQGDVRVSLNTSGNSFFNGGNVGIGTTSPTTKLTVEGTLAVLSLKGIDESGISWHAGNELKWILSRRQDDGGVNDDLKLLRYSGGVYRGIALQIENSTGNVGIGTSTPQSKLDIAGTVRATRFEDGTGSTYHVSPASSSIAAILNGKVGIGTTNPSDRLTVDGTVRLLQGGLKFPDDTIQTTASGASNWSQQGNNIYNTNTGNVGVGTSAPLEKLHVTGNVRASRIIDDDNPSYYVNPSGTPTAAAINGNVGIGTTSPVQKLDVVGTMAVSGDVGIGTTSPVAKLQVVGDLRAQRLLDDNNPTYLVDPGASGTAAVFNGSVGIGTTSPGAKLDVSGEIRASGNITRTNSSGSMRSRIAVTNEGVGLFETFSTTGKLNAQIGHLAGAPGNGTFSLSSESNGNLARVSAYVNPSDQGVIVADVKNFRTASPSKPGMDIWYAGIEGPEAAAYVRGTARLVNGRARIELPDHFLDVADLEGMTVQLTPMSVESKGLAVVGKGLAEGISVQELLGGTGSYDFDYSVTCVRKGFQAYEVVRPHEELIVTSRE